MPWAFVIGGAGPAILRAAGIEAGIESAYLPYTGNQQPAHLPRQPATSAPNCINCGAPHEPRRLSCSYCLTPSRMFTRLGLEP